MSLFNKRMASGVGVESPADAEQAGIVMDVGVGPEPNPDQEVVAPNPNQEADAIGELTLSPRPGVIAETQATNLGRLTLLKAAEFFETGCNIDTWTRQEVGKRLREMAADL